MIELVQTFRTLAAERGVNVVLLCLEDKRDPNAPPETVTAMDSSLLGKEWPRLLLSLHDAAQILIAKRAAEPGCDCGECPPFDEINAQIGMVFGAQSLLLAALEETPPPERGSSALLLLLALAQYLPGASAETLSQLLAGHQELAGAKRSANQTLETVRGIVALQRLIRAQAAMGAHDHPGPRPPAPEAG